MEWWKLSGWGGFLTALFCKGRVVWPGTLRMIQAAGGVISRPAYLQLIAEAHKDFTIKNKQ